MHSASLIDGSPDAWQHMQSMPCKASGGELMRGDKVLQQNLGGERGSDKSPANPHFPCQTTFMLIYDFVFRGKAVESSNDDW